MSRIGEPEIVFVVSTVAHEQPLVLTMGSSESLPWEKVSAQFPSLSAQVRAWLEHRLNMSSSVEQLYTHAERYLLGEPEAPVLSVSYLSNIHLSKTPGRDWKSWYDYLPWEDRRESATRTPFDISSLVSSLDRWCATPRSPLHQARLRNRIAILFGLPPHTWREDRALSRLQLLHAAGLIPDMEGGALFDHTVAGRAMEHDHRRILATAVSRVRANLFSHVVLFSFAPTQFTLLELQLIAEAVLGRRVHKQNFRRWAEPYVVPVIPNVSRGSHGRPARMFSTRASAYRDEPATGPERPRSDRIVFT
ncbi:NrtR DNA-binding winged helix domain-containing protein [Achromobacter xylosoxidans]|mgnify:FL=1